MNLMCKKWIKQFIIFCITSDLNNPKAQYDLGIIYEKGEYIEIKGDNKKLTCFKWFWIDDKCEIFFDISLSPLISLKYFDISKSFKF